MKTIVLYLEKLLRVTIPPWFRFVAFFACLGYIALYYTEHLDRKTGFTGMLMYGERFESAAIAKVKVVPRAIVPGLGFDGQFYATMAVDPLLQDPGLQKTMDVPSYRYRRIALSWIAFVAGLGRPALVLNVYALLNGVFWCLLAALLFFVFRPRTLQHYLICALLLFGTGTRESLSCAMTDLPAAVFILAGVLLPGIRPLSIGAALLTRETSLLAVSAVGVSFKGGLWRFHWKGIAVAVLPFVAWVAYVFTRTDGSLSAGFINNCSWPLVAMAHRAGSSLYHLRDGFDMRLITFVLVAASFSVQFLYFFRYREATLAAWRIGVSFALLFACLGSMVWMDYYWVIRTMLPMTFAFCLCLADAQPGRFLRWWPAGVFASLFFR